MPPTSAIILVSTALLLGVLPHVAAHGGGGAMDMGEQMAELAEHPDHKALSYVRHPDYWNWHLAHTVLMVLAWFICMPLAIFLSVARSRFHLPAQVLFHIVDGLGIFTGVVYNQSTPDLYVDNAHHPLGWVIVAMTIVWTLLSMYSAYGEHARKQSSSVQRPLTFAAQSMAHFDTHSAYNDESSRDSRDSGFGSRQNSTDSVYRKPEGPPSDHEFDDEKLDDADSEQRRFLGSRRVDRFLAGSVQRFSFGRAVRILRISQIFLEKSLLLLGFAGLTSGFIISGGLFRDRQIFNGLAHYIKGGIFFWYGLLTLGRWMGAFTEFGWAWNIRPQPPLVSKWKSTIPSAEFTESFVIWLYGATNVFLEHLNGKNGVWTASDIEHLSITILFFGGGLLGMLVECGWARNLMNTSILDQRSRDIEGFRSAMSMSRLHIESEEQRWEEPQSHRTSLNPMPALTIMLLGMIMGSHHQNSMISTMMHAQWGGLFSAFAIARGVTYITMYLKPPTSHFPSRPPSELVAAFCLTSGGLMFMNSAADCVWAIESNGLDAMTIFTLTMGLTGVILAWEVVLFAMKGWAVRREEAAAESNVEGWEEARKKLRLFDFCDAKTSRSTHLFPRQVLQLQVSNMPPKKIEKKRRNKRKTRTEVSSASSSSSSSDTENDVPIPTNSVKRAQHIAQEPDEHSALNTGSDPAPVFSQKKHKQDPHKAFEEFYLRQVTKEFANDLDRLRSAGDFNAKSLPLLISALKQGTACFGNDEKRKVVESLER
ncbi:putative membrane protein C3B8.06 [Cercospora zeina]